MAIFLEATIILDHIFLPSWNLSYAEVVLKDMTKPNTVPNTVNIWFEMDSEWGVNSDTRVTTVIFL
jgi:hypothetical protein